MAGPLAAFRFWKENYESRDVFAFSEKDLPTTENTGFLLWGGAGDDYLIRHWTPHLISWGVTTSYDELFITYRLVVWEELLKDLVWRRVLSIAGLLSDGMPHAEEEIRAVLPAD